MATQRVIAEHLGLSERRVRDVLRALGLPTRGCDLDQARIRYIEHLRGLASGHGAPGDELDLARERAALAKAQRTQIEQNMRVRRRELVEREPVRRAFRHAAITARDAVLAVPDRVSAVLAAESDPDALHARLTEELRAALERLADDRHQLAAEAEATAGTEETNG